MITKEDIYVALNDIANDLENGKNIQALQKILRVKEDLVDTPSAYMSSSSSISDYLDGEEFYPLIILQGRIPKRQ